jgi:hypothetical protein
MAAQIKALDLVKADPTIITGQTLIEAVKDLSKQTGEPVTPTVIKGVADALGLEFGARRRVVKRDGTRQQELARILACLHRDLLVSLGQPVPKVVTAICGKHAMEDVLAAMEVYRETGK